MHTAWRRAKDHAKSRKSKKWPDGIPFKITIGQFIIFAKQSDYLNRTGNNGRSLTIDRIDDDRGYIFSRNPKLNNIQPLTRIKNSEKKARQDKIRLEKGYAWQQNEK